MPTALNRRFFYACLYDQAHRFHSPAVFGAGGDDINSGGVNAGMSENIRQLGNILFDSVKYPGEQMPEIMRKNLLRIDVGCAAEGFHFPPDIRAAYCPAGSGDKNHAGFDAMLGGVAEQFFTQLFDDEYRPGFRLAGDGCLTGFDGLNRDILQLADPNACPAYRLLNQV